MGCHTTKTTEHRITLNKEKSIGKVLFIVEGNRKEHTLLTHIFGKILDYDVVNVKRNGKPVLGYKSKSNSNSMVFVFCSEESAMNSINTGQEYLNSVFKVLWEKYKLDSNNTATYYIFDRDPMSNKAKVVEELTEILRSSRDNGYERNGLLIVSYPSVESFVIACFDNTCHEHHLTAAEAKKYIDGNKFQQNKIDEERIEIATDYMLQFILEKVDNGFSINELDDFSKTGKSIFEIEEKEYKNTEGYHLLSLLSIAFLDMGLLTINE